MSYLVTTKITPKLCPRCMELTLVGLSDGLMARVDPHKVDRDLEIVAILTGRWTYAMIDRKLYRRAEGPSRCSGVYAEHRCLDPLPYPPTENLVKNDQVSLDDEPPY